MIRVYLPCDKGMLYVEDIFVYENLHSYMTEVSMYTNEVCRCLIGLMGPRVEFYDWILLSSGSVIYNHI